MLKQSVPPPVFPCAIEEQSESNLPLAVSSMTPPPISESVVRDLFLSLHSILLLIFIWPDFEFRTTWGQFPGPNFHVIANPWEHSKCHIDWEQWCCHSESSSIAKATKAYRSLVSCISCYRNWMDLLINHIFRCLYSSNLAIPSPDNNVLAPVTLNTTSAVAAAPVPAKKKGTKLMEANTSLTARQVWIILLPIHSDNYNVAISSRSTISNCIQWPPLTSRSFGISLILLLLKWVHSIHNTDHSTNISIYLEEYETLSRKKKQAASAASASNIKKNLGRTAMSST